MYMDASWRIWSIDSKETFSRDAAHIIGLHLNILTPVPDVSTVKLMKITCNLLEPRQLLNHGMIRVQTAADLEWGYFINEKNTHVCYI